MKIARHERRAWGAAFRRARRAGADVVEALVRADVVVLCMRGRAVDVDAELRQLELIRRGPRRPRPRPTRELDQLELRLPREHAEQLELELGSQPR